MRISIAFALIATVSVAHAQTPRDCGSMWKEADSDANGSLSRQEDRFGYLDAFRSSGRTPLAAGALSRDEFMLYCEGTLARSSAGTLQHRGAEGPIDRGKGDLTPGLVPFPKEQALRRIEALGYRDIGELVLDDKGIWRTKATSNGKQIEISVDVQGDVLAGG